MLTPDEHVYEIVAEFIRENKITCAEAIAQNDDVITNAYDFIEDLCEVVGYYEYPEDE